MEMEYGEYKEILQDFDLYNDMCSDLHDLIIEYGKKGMSIQATAAAFTHALEAIALTGVSQKDVLNACKLFTELEKAINRSLQEENSQS